MTKCRESENVFSSIIDSPVPAAAADGLADEDERLALCDGPGAAGGLLRERVDVVAAADERAHALPHEDRVGEAPAQLGHALDAAHAAPVLAQDLEVAVVVGGDGDLLADGGHLPRALLELDALRQQAPPLAKVDEE